MTQTEKLRALLRERGVEYMTDDGEHVRATKWMHEMCECEYYEYDDGTTFTNIILRDATPEQAVETTLGRGECEVVAERSYDYGYASVGVVHEMDLSCGHTWHDLWPPNFCPKCGAKVIDEWVVDE